MAKSYKGIGYFESHHKYKLINSCGTIYWKIVWNDNFQQLISLDLFCENLFEFECWKKIPSSIIKIWKSEDIFIKTCFVMSVGWINALQMPWHSFMRSKENEKLQGFAWKRQNENNESDGRCSGSGKGKHRPNEQSNKIPWQSQIAQCSFCTYSVFFLVITLFLRCDSCVSFSNISTSAWCFSYVRSKFCLILAPFRCYRPCPNTSTFSIPVVTQNNTPSERIGKFFSTRCKQKHQRKRDLVLSNLCLHICIWMHECTINRSCVCVFSINNVNSSNPHQKFNRLVNQSL